MASLDFNDLLDRLDDESDRAALADLEQQRGLFLKYAVRAGSFPDKRARLQKEYEAGASLTGPRASGASWRRLTWSILAGPTWATISKNLLRTSTASWTTSGFRVL